MYYYRTAWDTYLHIHRSSFSSAVFFVIHNMDSRQYKLFYVTDTWLVQLEYLPTNEEWGSKNKICFLLTSKIVVDKLQSIFSEIFLR